MPLSPLPKAQNTSLFAKFTAQPYLLLTMAPLFWAGNAVAGKIAVGEVDTYLLVILRWLGACLILLTIALPHVRKDWPKIKPNLGWLGFYGAIGFTTFNALIYSAAHFTSAANISIEQSAIPVFVLIGNFVLFKTRARPIQILGVVVTIVGIIWVATGGAPQKLLTLDVNIGDGLMILCALSYAIYSLGLRYKPDIHWLSFIMVTAFFALITALIYQLFLGGGFSIITTQLANVTPKGWLVVLYVMIFPSILSQLCFARGVELVGSNRASIFINLIPIFGTVLSVLIIGEQLHGYHLIASALVFVGIVLSEYAVRGAP